MGDCQVDSLAAAAAAVSEFVEFRLLRRCLRGGFGCCRGREEHAQGQQPERCAAAGGLGTSPVLLLPMLLPRLLLLLKMAPPRASLLLC